MSKYKQHVYTQADYDKHEQAFIDELDSDRFKHAPGHAIDRMYQFEARLYKAEVGLKRQGHWQGALTLAELITGVLDRLYPDAKPRTIVVHDGARYKLRFYPEVQAKSGRTYAWGHYWEEVSD